MNIGKRLKDLRKENSLSMDSLVEKLNREYNLNITKSMISRWENNKRIISTPNASLYCKYFNISLDYIFNGINTIETILDLEENQKLNKNNTKKLMKFIPPSSDVYYQDFNENILSLVEFSEIGISQIREIINSLCKKQNINLKDIMYIVGIKDNSEDAHIKLNNLLKIAKYFGIMPYFKLLVDFSDKIEILEKQKKILSKTNSLTIDELKLLDDMVENLIKIKNNKEI